MKLSDRQSELFTQLSDAVLELDEDRAAQGAQAVVDKGLDAYEAVDKGLAHGMGRAGKLFEEDEYFVPELLIAADAMYAGINIQRPHIKIAGGGKGRAVIGAVEGDTHDIGKNLVKSIHEAKVFIVNGLGRDVPPKKFVEAAKADDADIIALSTLMTTTRFFICVICREVG